MDARQVRTVLERVFPTDQLEYDDWEVDHWIHHSYTESTHVVADVPGHGAYGNRRGAYREVMAITCHVAVPFEECHLLDESLNPPILSKTMPGWVYAGHSKLGYDLVTMYETPGPGADKQAIDHYHKTGEWWDPVGM